MEIIKYVSGTFRVVCEALLVSFAIQRTAYVHTVLTVWCFQRTVESGWTLNGLCWFFSNPAPKQSYSTREICEQHAQVQKRYRHDQRRRCTDPIDFEGGLLKALYLFMKFAPVIFNIFELLVRFWWFQVYWALLEAAPGGSFGCTCW